jgi:hypothetical protein
MPFADAAAGKSIATSVATGNHRLIMRLDDTSDRQIARLSGYIRTLR